MAKNKNSNKNKKSRPILYVLGFILLFALVFGACWFVFVDRPADRKEASAEEKESETSDSGDDVEEELSAKKEDQEPEEQKEAAEPKEEEKEKPEENQPESVTIVEQPVEEFPQVDLSQLSTEVHDYGYSRSNRDERNVPTDMEWYESQWGQFNVDFIQDTGQNVIYLTMDEGFANDTTAQILDILKEKDVKAVFFLTKNFADAMPDMVQRMIDEGHQLGNHTCTHPRMPEISVEEQTQQIVALQDQIRDQFGYDMKYFRFPEGAYSDQSLGLANNLGLKVVFWSYAYGDYSDEQPPVAESLELALSELHPGAIYLLHASSTTNAAFLADWIDQCRERGFEFGVYPSAPH